LTPNFGGGSFISNIPVFHHSILPFNLFACANCPNRIKPTSAFASNAFDMTTRQLQSTAREHGTPVVVIDHDIIRANYAAFKKHLPKIQAYYAVKANAEPAIVRTLYKAGASFDVASLPEFMLVYENIKSLPPKEQQDFIWDKIIYANPTKPRETLQALDQYKPLVTYDNLTELKKIKQYAPHAGVVLRLRVPNTGSMVELSSKFGCDPGEAVDLIVSAFGMGLVVEGLSFHVGSQCTNFQNFVQALNIAAAVMHEAKTRGHEIKILDIGGGFPAPYDKHVKPFSALAKKINAEIDRLFPKEIQILAEPGRFLVATAATSIASIIGKAVREGKTCYYIDDSVYHTFSGIIFDHCQYHLKAFKKGKTEICAVFGQTCDALDTISLSEELPSLEIEDLVYSENIGAYSNASATWFNGFPPAKVVHINE
jgi:ornithine decarboxylase